MKPKNRKESSKRQAPIIGLFIVEGCTEENYIKLLKTLYRSGHRVHNCKGGSAKNVLKEARTKIRENEHDFYVLLFDADTDTSDNDQEKRNIQEVAKGYSKEIAIIVSEPCFENWLLAHFGKRLPHKDCKSCERELAKSHIPNYKKNDCVLLERHIEVSKIWEAVIFSEEIGKPLIIHPFIQPYIKQQLEAGKVIHQIATTFGTTKEIIEKYVDLKYQ